jgi:hypothetical protein
MPSPGVQLGLMPEPLAFRVLVGKSQEGGIRIEADPDPGAARGRPDNFKGDLSSANEAPFTGFRERYSHRVAWDREQDIELV